MEENVTENDQKQRKKRKISDENRSIKKDNMNDNFMNIVITTSQCYKIFSAYYCNEIQSLQQYEIKRTLL